MSFSINTNVASLSAQNYLRINSNFQNQTINRVTSGLRIVQSGDDAAGLAIANSLRSDQAVLTQGVRNANDGLSQLQIIDGGMSNISQLLDRARTLATQSASGTFTGDRSVLDGEYQSVLGEIDRQAQAIGLNEGGTFAKSLQVFIGGGKGTNASAIINNGSVGVNLSASTVDAKSLGLEGVQALGGASGTDIGPGSPKTSVQAILGDTQNTASESVAGYTQFNFYGPGFSNSTGSNVVKVSVNLSGVTDASTLAAAVNQAIQNAGNAGSQQATAFKNANITASVVTDADGHQQLAFGSSTAAFQVQGADRVANAFMGQFVDTTSASHPALGQSSVATAASSTAYSTSATGGTYELRLVSSAFANGYHDYAVTTTASQNAAAVLNDVQTAIAGNAAGVQVQDDGSGHLQFYAPAGQSFEVQVAGDVTNDLGLGTYQKSAGGNFDYNTITAGAPWNAGGANAHLEVSVAGGSTIDLGTIAAGATELAGIDNLNAAFQGNATLRAIGLTATDNGGSIVISSAGADFRINAYAAGTDAFGLVANTNSVTSSGDFASATAAKTSVNSGGAYASVNGGTGTGVNDVYAFNAMRLSTDKQTISLAATDPTGQQHTLNIALSGGLAGNAYNVDNAVAAINTALQQSDDPVMQGIVAVKERNSANTADGIRFMSATNSFSVSLGQTSDPAGSVGLSDGNTGSGGVAQGEILTSQVQGTGATSSIASQDTASAAVSALSAAVGSLGKAQAVVGRGENQFNYAINLAQSQLTNMATAESRIRDADLASEAANLTKAQILMQAGVAALAQANSAPQQVLSLLRS